MLSKLRHFSREPGGNILDLRTSVNLGPLQRYLGECAIQAQAVDGGTLGAGFIAQINGQRRFLKTHISSGGRVSLDKEISILSCLYGATIHLDRIEIDCADTSQIWLVMDELVFPQVDFNIEQILALIDSYSQKLQQYSSPHLIPAADNFAHLLQEGVAALRNLTHIGMLSEPVHQKALSCFSFLDQQMDSFTPCLCHGDFGPKNLMFDGTCPIAIDWEDAFWGIKGYDYLYWLTFFNNRKYYSQEIFGKTPWGKEVEIAILILIIVLKCELSFRSNSYRGNGLTFDQRIMEIVALE